MGLEAHLQRLRKFEIESLRAWFRPNIRVLEIGGGSGYQASLISAYGCEVCSIDLPGRPVPEKIYYSVTDYDGQKILFPDGFFDLVFSSNVLEHIEPLAPIFKEIHRVLKPEGTIIHVLPSVTWRFWTSLAHYAYILKCLLIGKIESMGKQKSLLIRDVGKGHGLMFLLKRVFIAGPHGIYPNAVSELYYFSRFRWIALFHKNGFDLLKISGNGLFYTGYGVFHDLSISIRRKVAWFLGSSCHIFVMRIRDSLAKS
ncbi:hypothetical protein MNBD_NITROSPIRAE01-841 [hydrothermal vent metagenome]|uniref:Methyltransferase type 11 domain-containing protein n=1 Tax=hydrothermal vent metagenome TaxID=652676 RepID=A0A3B1C9N1_9ZZZZ